MPAIAVTRQLDVQRSGAVRPVGGFQAERFSHRRVDADASPPQRQPEDTAGVGQRAFPPGDAVAAAVPSAVTNALGTGAAVAASTTTPYTVRTPGP